MINTGLDLAPHLRAEMCIGEKCGGRNVPITSLGAKGVNSTEKEAEIKCRRTNSRTIILHFKTCKYKMALNALSEFPF